MDLLQTRHVQTKTDTKTALLVRISYEVGVVAALLATVAVISILAQPAFLDITTRTAAGLVIFQADPTNSVTLSWTSPGDDGTLGQATTYDVRYRVGTSMSTAQWTNATQLANEPAPSIAGSAESFTVTGLTPNTSYAFGIKTQDDAGNWSPLSNIATKKTTCTESWTCTAWSACSNGTQSRTCSDLNACGTTASTPSTMQSCTPGSGTPPVGGGSETDQESFVVAVPNAGGGPQVRVLNGQGEMISQFFAYHPNYRGGVHVAVGDLGFDGIDEIVVGPGSDAPPIVKVFSFRGELLYEFFAYSSTYRGGVQVAIGNVDGKSGAEIITLPATNGGANVQLFGWKNGGYSPTILNFFAFDKHLRGNWSLAVGDLDANGRAEILTAPAAHTGGPHVRIFEYRGNQLYPNILGFFAYPEAFQGGVQLATGHLDARTGSDILTAPLSLGGPHVRLFHRQSDGRITLAHNGYMAFHLEFRGGVSLATGDFSADGRADVVTAVASGDQALVRIWEWDGSVLHAEFAAFPDTMRSGVNIAVGHFFSAP